MTAIVSWISKENEGFSSIWVVGDTKIQNKNETLTLEGAKVLELPIKCKDISTINQEIYFSSTLGYAYAGSSLVALNVYCYLLTAFSNLGGIDKNKLPNHKDILLNVKDILKRYVSSVRSVSELMIFGFCPKERKPFIGTIKPLIKEGEIDFVIDVKTEVSDKVEVVILGDEKESLNKLIEKKLVESYRLNKKPIDYWRTPAKVLKEIIIENRFPSIGGNLQLAIANLYGFGIYSVVVPIKGYESKATLKFRNIDVFNDVRHSVGECIVSINGMSL